MKPRLPRITRPVRHGAGNRPEDIKALRNAIGRVRPTHGDILYGSDGATEGDEMDFDLWDRIQAYREDKKLPFEPELNPTGRLARTLFDEADTHEAGADKARRDQAPRVQPPSAPTGTAAPAPGLGQRLRVALAKTRPTTADTMFPTMVGNGPDEVDTDTTLRLGSLAEEWGLPTHGPFTETSPVVKRLLGTGKAPGVKMAASERGDTPGRKTPDPFAGVRHPGDTRGDGAQTVKADTENGPQTGRNGTKRIVNPIEGGKLRDDERGDGRYGAGRERPDGSVYDHQGVDIQAAPGQNVRSPVDGKVVRTNVRPYRNDDRYGGIEIETENGERIKMFYMSPNVNVGDKIRAGDTIGETQNISKKHGNGMQNHIHIEYRKNGKLVNPTIFIE